MTLAEDQGGKNFMKWRKAETGFLTFGTKWAMVEMEVGGRKRRKGKIIQIFFFIIFHVINFVKIVNSTIL